MTDHTSKDSSGSSSGRPGSSLVERAAKKIVADSIRSPAVDSESTAPAQPTPEAARMSAPAAVERVVGSGAPRPQMFEGLAAEAHVRPGGMPDVGNGGQRRRSKAVKIDMAGLAARNILTPQSKRSRMVEEFRLIKRKLIGRRWTSGDGNGNTIVVTSALPQEGKTTIAINLAMSIAAEEDLRVLLIDADFIRPNALRQLGVSADKGLIDVIHDPSIDIADVMLATDIDKLSLIPSGRLHDRCTELLASARMSDLIREMATRYEDRILIFDSPPVLATTEAVTLASHMSRVVFVVQAERTRRELVASALELLGNPRHLGLVLNKATPSLGSAEFGSYYGAYYYHTPNEVKESEPAKADK